MLSASVCFLTLLLWQELRNGKRAVQDGVWQGTRLTGSSAYCRATGGQSAATGEIALLPLLRVGFMLVADVVRHELLPLAYMMDD